MFSDEPGKVKNYQCKLQFKENVEFNRRSYPIAQSLKEAVRTEINKMIENDIIEISQSPYTSPIIAVPKKDGQVRLCLDAVSYTHLDVYKRQGRYRAQLGSSMTAYFLGKVRMAKHLEPAIPEECLVNKISYHYDEDLSLIHI